MFLIQHTCREWAQRESKAHIRKARILVVVIYRHNRNLKKQAFPQGQISDPTVLFTKELKKRKKYMETFVLQHPWLTLHKIYFFILDVMLVTVGNNCNKPLE